MEPTMLEQIFEWGIKILAVSGGAAWIAAILTNKRGTNQALDFVMDIIELVGANINKAKNDPNV